MIGRSQPCQDEAGGTAQAKALWLVQAGNSVAGAGDVAKAVILRGSWVPLKRLELFLHKVGNCWKIRGWGVTRSGLHFKIET